MKEEIYSVYKFYDKRGRRLAIFAQEISPNILEVFVLTCSTKDRFVKQTARDVYHHYKIGGIPFNNIISYGGNVYHPAIFNILVEEGKPRSSFLKWCNENFYIKRIQKVYRYPSLVEKLFKQDKVSHSTTIKEKVNIK